MHPGVGPYDGRRAKRKRCKACTTRKIKCQGGIPCEYCRKTKQPCLTPIPKSNSTLVFVNQGRQVAARNKAPETPPISLLHCDFERDLNYFTACFLPMNLFSGQSLLAEKDLRAIIHDSPASEHAIAALSSLHRCLTSREGRHDNSTRQDLHRSMESYSQSVKHVQHMISNQNVQPEPHMLWSTFLLGLFELMRDNTGQNWIKHFLSGTCAILRLQHPSSLTSHDEHSLQRRRFFLDTRIFEISRSLIFTEPTFLAEPSWTDALALLWANDEGLALWHPKEALFDLLPKISDLSMRAAYFCYDEAAQISAEECKERADSLAVEGLWLQRMLQDWSSQAMQWRLDVATIRQRDPSRIDRVDVDYHIAQVYFHAISIYLSGTFDYHDHWTNEDAPCAPIITRDEVEHHLAEIFHFSCALLESGVAGVLLFFPLRVAGARSKRFQDQDLIISLFGQISRRGYSTATTFIAELGALWGTFGAPS